MWAKVGLNLGLCKKWAGYAGISSANYTLSGKQAPASRSDQLLSIFRVWADFYLDTELATEAEIKLIIGGAAQKLLAWSNEPCK